MALQLEITFPNELQAHSNERKVPPKVPVSENRFLH